MILKRLAKGIRQQDWFTVVIEILVVVVGLLLGLQIDDWNNTRLERQEERVYLERISAELDDYIKDFEAVRQRRAYVEERLTSFSDALYGRTRRDDLTAEECRAIISSHILAAYVAPLPALSELTTSGRMQLLRNEDLRAAIVATQLARERVTELMTASNLEAFNFRSRYPELIRVESYFDEEEQSVRVRAECDLQGMQNNQAFRNEASTNLDLYDAFYNIRLGEYGTHLRELLDMARAELSAQ